MAKKTTTKSQELNQEKVQEAKAEPRYLVSSLRKNCIELFGITSSTFDGAMYGHDPDREYSIEEMKKIIDVFLNGGTE